MRRRLMTIAPTAALTLGVLAGPAAAMQPPGEPAQDNFGCVTDDEGNLVDDPVAGHPGAAGIVDASVMIRDELTGDQTPTAWNAVEHAEPIDFGSC